MSYEMETADYMVALQRKVSIVEQQNQDLREQNSRLTLALDEALGAATARGAHGRFAGKQRIMSGVIQHVVGNVQFGPAHHSLWEEQPSLRELYDQACAGLIRAECEADELRAEVAMLQEQARILASERDGARPSPHLKQLPQEGLLDADATPETLSSVAWATDVSGWPTYLVVNALVAQELERERDEARVQFGAAEQLGLALVKTIDELKEDLQVARKIADSAMLEADKLRAKRGACIYEIAESVREKYDPADEVDGEEA